MGTCSIELMQNKNHQRNLEFFFGLDARYIPSAQATSHVHAVVPLTASSTGMSAAGES
jgi:hypothetical protein